MYVLVLLFTFAAARGPVGKTAIVTSSTPTSLKDNDGHFGSRNTDHIANILLSDFNRTRKSSHISHWFSFNEKTNEVLVEEALQKLVEIYNSAVKPLEDAYYFREISHMALSDSEFFALPRVLFIGPWSTGKSSLINYVMGLENTTLALPAGAQPTTSDFVVLSHGDNYKIVDGSVLVIDSKYSSLAKFGSKFLDKLENVEIPSDILQKVNFIDTPGILENRKQQERGYPFSEVCHWFVDHSDLIVLVFDPTKMDVGSELESLFKLLRRNENKVRIILNKADSVTPQELLRLYGSLFWNLSPHINVTDPPRVYIGSFWSKSFSSVSKVYHKVFLDDEMSLLHDIKGLSCTKVQSRMAFLRNYALKVRNHALVVDQYLQTFFEQGSFFVGKEAVADDIAKAPEQYGIFEKVLSHLDISKFDLFSPSQYYKFFSIHDIDSFQPLSKHCGYISPCLLDSVNSAIYDSIPLLLQSFESASAKVCYSSPEPLNNMAKHFS